MRTLAVFSGFIVQSCKIKWCLHAAASDVACSCNLFDPFRSFLILTAVVD